MPKKKKYKQDQAVVIQSFSKNLLGLKFMQRAQKEAEKAANEEDDDDDEMLEAALKNSKLLGKQKCIINPSYQFCERLRFGRFSFKGMNLDIETIMLENDEASADSDRRTGGVKRSAEDGEEYDESTD